MPGELCKRRFVDDAVGMDDLRDAVVHLHGAGDVAPGADRQQFFDIAGLGAEEGQHHVAGVVAGIDQIAARADCAAASAGGGRRSPPASPSVPGTASRIFGRARRSITLAGRCSSRSTSRGVLIAAEQIAEQFVLLRPDAGKAGDRRKQRIEQSRAHRET